MIGRRPAHYQDNAMDEEAPVTYRSLSRIGKAFGYSLAGLRHATAHESAFQQELIVVAVLTIVCFVLPFDLLLTLLLVIGHLLILIIELLNTAIEALADKVCTDIDPLIKQTKDAGSAAVLLTIFAVGLLWAYAIFTLL
jgi:diacylglycerol kinase (ATP)